MVELTGVGASAFAELRLRSATRLLTAGLRLTASSSHLLGAGSLRLPISPHLVKMLVELTGVEPVTQRCERCVIPLYYSPNPLPDVSDRYYVYRFSVAGEA